MNHPAGRIGKRLILRVRDVMLTGSSLPLIGPDVYIMEVRLSPGVLLPYLWCQNFCFPGYASCHVIHTALNVMFAWTLYSCAERYPGRTVITAHLLQQDWIYMLSEPQDTITS